MDQMQVVKALKNALVKSKLARTALAPKELGVGRGKGTLLAEGADGNWYRINVTVIAAEIAEEG